jgi:uncharacterized RmlC-like cupin family protein
MDETHVGCVVRGSESYESQQGPTYAPGVSAETVGAKALFLGVVTMVPGGSDHVAHSRPPRVRVRNSQ